MDERNDGSMHFQNYKYTKKHNAVWLHLSDSDNGAMGLDKNITARLKRHR